MAPKVRKEISEDEVPSLIIENIFGIDSQVPLCEVGRTDEAKKDAVARVFQTLLVYLEVDPFQVYSMRSVSNINHRRTKQNPLTFFR